MEKLDSHQHFWDLKRFAYPWLSPVLQVLYRNYEPSDLKPILDASGVSGTIAVQATHDVQEAHWLLSLARGAPFIRGVVGWVDLAAPDLLEQVERLRAEGPLCGIRHQVHDEPNPEWLLESRVVEGLRLLAAHGIAYDLLLRPIHLRVLPRLFAAVPDGRWVIDHLAKPEIAARRYDSWARDMVAVAEHPNVACKISGMITEADQSNWQIDDLRRPFETVLRLFGPDRLMFGSDWPVCLLAGTYPRVIEAVTALVSGLTEAEQAAIWSGTAHRIYRV